MAVTLNDVVAQMRSLLSLTEPDLDTTVGTPTRKIIDAVGEVIAETYVDRHLLEYQYDIDAKTAEDLDEFVRLFGFARFPAKRATGMVTFERTSVATADLLIPVGTQMATEGAAPIIVQTTVPALLTKGELSVQVPVQATVGGTSGNIPANALRNRVTPFEGINSFTNVTALTGGADEESDEQLRKRFKETVFRNMAGTEQMFLATALNDPAVTHVNVLGATKVFRESLEVVGGLATPTVQDARYIYSGSEVFGPDIDSGNILTPGVHYTFDSGTGSVTVIDSGVAPDGIYDLLFEYVPDASRNDPPNGITNRIDVYVNGQRATEAAEVAIFDTTKVFSAGGNYPVANFQRTDGSQPVAANYFVPLAFSPVIDPAISNVITSNGIDYSEGTDFFLVNDITRDGGTPNSLSGIEFVSTANGATQALPTSGTAFDVQYVFNAVPRDVELALRQWRLVTTDARVHQARPLLLNLHLAVIYRSGYSEGQVRPELEAALSAYIANVGFNGVVQVSDILEVAHRVAGVDAVRFLTSSDDGTNYAIQRVSTDGTLQETYATSVAGQIRRALDVFVGDDEYPVLNSVVLVAKANNTFGAV